MHLNLPVFSFVASGFCARLGKFWGSFTAGLRVLQALPCPALPRVLSSSLPVGHSSPQASSEASEAGLVLTSSRLCAKLFRLGVEVEWAVTELHTGA